MWTSERFRCGRVRERLALSLGGPDLLLVLFSPVGVLVGFVGFVSLLVLPVGSS